MISKITEKSRLLLTSSAALAIATSMMYAPMASAVVPNDNVGPEDSVDNEGGINGVGMFFRTDGFVCTGTLINPRTVLFAAHCVNDVPESDYGTRQAAAFSFGVNALPGFQDWFRSGFQTNVDANVFNVNQIFWNSESVVNPASRGFIEADIALASLDTPATNIPTWALLFSALPAPDALSIESGTGYHVNITGYGATGEGGSTGDNLGIDFRRRVAENYIGALTSINQRDEFIFGSPPNGPLPQNLYFTDFDTPQNQDPSIFDFNNTLDEALPNEGITAGGDSGGPLILDAANNDITDMDIVIGVLSGGSRFFNDQPGSSYGTDSFYQPLFAFYDYIAANNPYRYVSAQAGDGNWEDASHWVTENDPNYFIFDDDFNLVNGLPDTPEEGRASTEGDFGTVCVQFPFRTPAPFDCRDVSTGEDFSSQDLADDEDEGGETLVAARVEDALGRVAIDEVAGDLAVVSADTADEAIAANLSIEGLEDVAISGGVNLGELEDTAISTGLNIVELEDVAIAGALESDEVGLNVSNAVDDDGNVIPTIDNGRAGASNFVPNNIDPDVLAGVNARYFDVTLSANGTTTLSSDVTIDRLAINGANTGLNIASTGNLTSIVEVEQVSGTVNVDGSLTTFGDYLLLSGMLTGSGTIATPFFTNVMGGIAPGGNGSFDTLTIDGSAVLASASGLMIDIGANGVSDTLAITGDSSIGGQVMFLPTADVLAGNQYTFLTTAGTQTGELSVAGPISAILSASLSYTDSSVIATIEAGSYDNVIDTSNAVQSSYAKMLDGARGASALAPIFANLDLASTDAIQDVLDSWAPVTETTVRSLSRAATENLVRFHRDRLSAMNTDEWSGGTVTEMGNPVQMASNDQFSTVMSDVGYLQASNGEGSMKTTGKIPDDMAVYLSGSFIDGDSAAMPTAQNFGEEDFDGWSVSGGVEKRMSEKASVGASLSYTQLEAEASLGQFAETDYFAGTLYGQLRAENNFVLDGQVSLGSFSSETERTVTSFPGPAILETEDVNTIFSSDIRVSKVYETGNAIVTPRVSLQNTVIDFDTVEEAGGAPALSIQRSNIVSTQGRIGLELSTAADSKFDLSAYGDFVNEFDNVDDSFNAGFVASPGATADFALFGTDKNWAEIGVGLGFNVQNAKINLSADTTLGRKDFETRVYRAGVTYKF